MATSRQIEANRLNAQNSTGPRTPQGKAVSSQNALKSGLDAESQFVVGEDRSEFAELQHEYIARFQPLTPEERFQVDSLLRNEWTLRRLFRAEAHLWEYYTIRADRSEGVPLGEALVAGHEAFRRLQRRITLCERSYKDAFAELERLQRARRSLAAAEANPEPDDPTPPGQPADTPRELGSFLHSPVDSVSDATGERDLSPVLQRAEYAARVKSSSECGPVRAAPTTPLYRAVTKGSG
jgi:hypothetical protein